MHSKRGILLLRRRCALLPPNPNPNSANFSSFHPPSINPILDSSRIRTPLLPRNLASSSLSRDHFLPQLQILQFFRNSSLDAQRSSGRSSSMARHDARFSSGCNLALGPEKLSEIVEEIARGADAMESNLDKMNFRISSTAAIQILRALNNGGLPAMRFFHWALERHRSFEPNSEIYNLIVNNLGRLEDYGSMHSLLDALSPKGFCLTEKAFDFVKLSSKDSVKKLTEVLNSVRGACRGSGIHALIKLLCSINSFNLAFCVMEETAGKPYYRNVMIAAKCRNGNFEAAMEALEDRRICGCDPNASSYNYLLGSLFKSGRVSEGCKLLQVMEESGYVPNSITYEVVALHACKADRMDYATEIIDLMLAEGIKPRLTTHAAFVKGFFRCGRIDDARNYVVGMGSKDKGSKNFGYSLLADLFRLSGRAVEASSVLRGMMAEGLKPNFPAYRKVLKELKKIARQDLASELELMFLKFDPRAGIG